MARQITDDEDRLKRQARRRLIGAVALTTAIVVVLPMVLDSEPKPVGQDIELRIPDKDKVGEFVPNMDAPPASAPVAAPALAPVAATPAPPVLIPPVTPAPVAPVPAITPPVALAPVTAKPVAVAAPSKSEPVKHDAKPEAVKAEPVKTEPVKTEPAKVEPAKPESKPDHVKAPATQAGFAVQVGAFSSAETAHNWQKNLSKQGFKAYTEKAGNKTRVRTGPYATREEANKARHKLEAKGLHTNIVELD